MQDTFDAVSGRVQTADTGSPPRNDRAQHCRFWKTLGPFSGSLAGACALLFLDIVETGSYVFSVLACPIWFVVRLMRVALQHPKTRGWGAVARVAIPVVTLALVLANGALQKRIATVNAERIIKACEEFRAAKGFYPNQLDELVPRYLGSIPPAKYRRANPEFEYRTSDAGIHMLWWHPFPAMSRRGYVFETGEWFFVD